MEDGAAHLVRNVFPAVPVRQWVLAYAVSRITKRDLATAVGETKNCRQIKAASTVT